MTDGQVSEFTGSDSGEAAGGESASVTPDDDIQFDMCQQSRAEPSHT